MSITEKKIPKLLETIKLNFLFWIFPGSFRTSSQSCFLNLIVFSYIELF